MRALGKHMEDRPMSCPQMLEPKVSIFGLMEAERKGAALHCALQETGLRGAIRFYGLSISDECVDQASASSSRGTLMLRVITAVVPVLRGVALKLEDRLVVQPFSACGAGNHHN